MAYFPVVLVAGLPVHPLGRQPQRKNAYLHQPDDYDVAGWSLAWCSLAFCDLGGFAWYRTCRSQNVEKSFWNTAKTAFRLASFYCRVYHLQSGKIRLDIFPGKRHGCG